MSRGRIYAGKAVILIEAEDRLDSALKGVQSKLYKIQNTIGQIGRTSATAGILSAGGQAVLLRRFSQFSDLMLELRVKMGLLKDVTKEQEMEFARLEKRIRDLGRSTSYTTNQVAEGAIRLAQAGFSGKEVEDTLQAVLDLARGTRTDLGEASRVAANAIRTFKLNTEDTSEVVSQFVVAARMGTVELDDLAESLKYASATAGSLGIKLPTLLAFFTMLSERGMRGSISGTSTNTFLANIAKKQEELKEMTGQEVPRLADGAVDFVGVLQGLDRATRGLDLADRLAAFQDLFNLRGGRAAIPVANEADIQRLMSLVNQISAAGDEARKAAEIMDSGLGGSIRRAVSALDDMNISLQKITEGPLIDLLNAIPPAANAMSMFIAQNQRLVLVLSSVPAALVGVGSAFLGLSFILRRVAGLIGGVRAGIGAIAPIVQGGAMGQLIKTTPGIAAAGRARAGRAMGGLSFYGRRQQVLSNRRDLYDSVTFRNAEASRQQAAIKAYVARMKAGFAADKDRVQLSIQDLGQRRDIELRNVLGNQVALDANERLLQRARAAGDGDKVNELLGSRGQLERRRKFFALRLKHLEDQLEVQGNRFFDLDLNEDSFRDNVARRARQMRAASATRMRLPKRPASQGLLGRLFGKEVPGSGKAVKAITGMASAFGKLGSILARANTWMWVLQGIILFGDRIPGVSDILNRLTNAFSGFFSVLGTMGRNLGPAFQLMQMSFGLLRDERTKDLGFEGMIASLQAMGSIIRDTIVQAWNQVKIELGYVWDFTKKILTTVWEVGKAILNIGITSIGNVLGSVIGAVGSRVRGMASNLFGEGGGTFDKLVTGLATFIAKMFEWVGYAVMKLNNMFLNFIDRFHIMLLEVLGRALRHLELTDTTGVERETIRGEMNRRNVEFNRDVKSNAQVVSDMQQAIQDAMASNAEEEGKIGSRAAQDRMKSMQQAIFNAMRQLQERAAQLTQSRNQPGGPGAQQRRLGPPTQEEIANVRYMVAALVGSVQNTRGNVLRAVTEDELKKQTRILSNIEANTAKAANPSFA